GRSVGGWNREGLSRWVGIWLGGLGVGEWDALANRGLEALGLEGGLLADGLPLPEAKSGDRHQAQCPKGYTPATASIGYGNRRGGRSS
ncbi:MAG: hypothetical protein DCF25_17415, partial [Leptolyngbya foveolarum]